MKNTGTTTGALTVRPDYGVDAPGVVRGLFGATAALAVAGGGVQDLVQGPWRLIGWLLLLGAAVLLALGVSMLFYAFRGKLYLRDRVLSLRAWRGDEVVLDIGAGRGLMAVGAAKIVPAGSVIAVDLWSAKDLSGNMPEALRRNAVIEGVEDRVRIVTGDARKLDLTAASVDVVVSVFCLHNIEPKDDRDAACREIARVLKPGGMAMIADFPGAGCYVDVFRSAGLEIDRPFRAEPIAFSIAGYIVATKPALVA